MGAAFADVAVAADDRDFAGDHDAGGALDAVRERFAAAVEIVELRLGDGVVDVDGRDEQLARFEHLVKAMDAGGGFFADTSPVLDDFVPETGAFLGDALEQILDDLFFVAAAGRVDPVAAFFEFVTFVDEQGDVAAVIDDRVPGLCCRG